MIMTDMQRNLTNDSCTYTLFVIILCTQAVVGSWIQNAYVPHRRMCSAFGHRVFNGPVFPTITESRSRLASAAETAKGQPQLLIEDNSGTTTTIKSQNNVRNETSTSALAIEDSAFDVLAGNIALCLHKSDLKRNDGFDGASTGWTSWVDDEAALRLKSCMDALELSSLIRKPQQQTEYHMLDELLWERVDEAIRFLRWIKLCPSPLMVELSPELRQAVNKTIPNEQFLCEIDSSREEFLERLGCRLILLPSGASLAHSLRAPPGAMIYGKLLLGGVTRFRMIGSQSSNRPRHRAGARTLITSPTTARTPSWLQYGGPERSYEAIDAGPCAFLEVLILPKGLHLPLLISLNHANNNHLQNNRKIVAISDDSVQDMTIAQMKWDFHSMLELVSEEEAKDELSKQDDLQASEENTELDEELLEATGNDYIEYLGSSFTASVGGLQPQIDSIIRRVLDGRAVAASTGSIVDDDTNTSSAGRATNMRRKEMVDLLDLGLQPVRGLLLHGLPGTGKTLVAREIAKVLKARPPKIVAAPELLDRWVGGSEKLVRELFQDAEDELRACNGDPTKSALHVIVIDEIDAVFRKRSSSSQDSSGEVTRASAVNQILSKLDGVKELGNILLIGMTNRKELLDEALLRPGRLEVQIEIPLPDQEGRREILKIHFEALRRKGLLSKSVCNAIDGRHPNNLYGDNAWWKKLSFRKSKSRPSYMGQRRIRDLASDRWTKGFSGADIAGLVRSAGSLALARARSQDGGGIENLLITTEDVIQALEEVKR